MFGRRGRRGGVQNTLAWLGLLLMGLSFAWLQWNPPILESPFARPRSTGEPFTVVVLDPGHGGQDSGAMVADVAEKTIALDLAQRVDRLLQMQGMATVMTRLGDNYISLAERVALTNRVQDCVLVSIHFNEGNKPLSTGVETYYADHQIVSGKPLISWLPFLQRTASYMANGESRALAGSVQDALVGRVQAVNRGVKAEQFFVIANVRHPAILVEGGFLTNKDDVAKLMSDDYRERMAGAISDGILRYRDLLRQRGPALATGAE